VCVASTSSIWSPQRMTGLSAVIGSWKIIDMRVQRRSRSRASSRRARCSPVSDDVAADGGERFGQQAHDRVRDDALARARFADEAHDLAAIARQADAVHGEGAIGAGRQRDRESADVEDGRTSSDPPLIGVCSSAGRACRAGHRPACSPRAPSARGRCRDRDVVRKDAEQRAPSAMMLPHVGVCGGMPTPRNDRIASIRIADAAMYVACTISGATVLGRTC
jgi:hypothetical protein